MREWWRIYGADHELWTLVARDSNGALLGIAPLVMERRHLGTRRLFMMGANEIQPDHLDFIVCAEAHAGVVCEFSAYLWQVRAQWDLLDLDSLPAESPTHQVVIQNL